MGKKVWIWLRIKTFNRPKIVSTDTIGDYRILYGYNTISVDGQFFPYFVVFYNHKTEDVLGSYCLPDLATALDVYSKILQPMLTNLYLRQKTTGTLDTYTKTR